MPHSNSTRQDPDKRNLQPKQQGSAPQGKNPPRRPEQPESQTSRQPAETPVTEDQEDDGGESLLSGQPRETGGERDIED